ncbi:MAG: LytTR family DNA-binding domain-containing protein [Armatimonadetes bacterium]|nr:LytTR family DNA-binding domain-containing protein [Armatimonadota bacterium]
MSLTALLVDDEPTARQFLRLLLERQEGVEVVGEAENGEEALQLAEELQPSVVFLDIQMPEMTGLEVARSLQTMEPPPWIVFATGYDEYAVDAFDAAAIDYLMKPYDVERLEKTIQRLRRMQSPEEGANGEKERVAQEITRLSPRITKMPIKVEETILLIDPSDILYVQARGRRVYVKTKLNDFPTHLTVTQFEQRLAGNNFFRANEGCLVNLDKVKEIIYVGDRSYELKLNDKEGTTVELSRSRSRALREMVKDLM